MNVAVPVRKRHVYTQRLDAPPARVFPLLCPVQEEKWVPEWRPQVVYTHSGHVEKDCIFLTEHEDRAAIWLVSRLEPEHLFMELYKVTPEHTVGKVEIQLSGTGQTTEATVSFEYTAIGPEGVDFLQRFTEQWYASFMKRWEEALNHFLRHGKKVSA